MGRWRYRNRLRHWTCHVGEIVVFDNGVKGMVQDIKRTEIGCILFGKDTGIREGTRVVRTGKKAGIPVGDAFWEESLMR